MIPPTVANGSTARVLKIFGDIHDDGKMVTLNTSVIRTGAAVRTSLP